jgi:hypothetical protein
MGNKQTAVEWLIQRIYMSDFEIYNFMKENGDFEQAKEMEKQQIMDAVNATIFDDDIDAYEYFTETYE